MDAMDSMNDDSDEYEYEYHQSETEVCSYPYLPCPPHPTDKDPLFPIELLSQLGPNLHQWSNPPAETTP